jgi:hypothetical protein
LILTDGFIEEFPIPLLVLSMKAIAESGFTANKFSEVATK